LSPRNHPIVQNDKREVDVVDEWGGHATKGGGGIHQENQPENSHPSKVKQAKAKTAPGVAIANIYRCKKAPRSKLKPRQLAHTSGRVEEIKTWEERHYIPTGMD
jgi:hypothetical protein